MKFPLPPLPKVSHEDSYFLPHELKKLGVLHLPHHVAIIPDGNRRWASERNLSPLDGYLEGIQRLITIALSAKELGISVLTTYTFSTENWRRPQDQVDLLMQLFSIHLNHYAEALKDASIRLFVIGDTSKLPLFLQDTIKSVIEKTKDGTKMDFVLAMNYGGRDELIRAFKKLYLAHKEDLLEILSEQSIKEALDTSSWEDPDLIIRTSGEERLSNFLLWQSSYSEVYIEPNKWPDFTPHHLLRAILNYQARKRRCGGDNSGDNN